MKRKDVERLLTDRINRDERVIEAKRKFQVAYGTGNLVLMGKATGEINKVKDIIEKELIEEFENSSATMGEVKDEMSKEDWLSFRLNMHYLAFFIDFIDLSSREINNIVGRTKGGGEIPMFNKINQLGKEAQTLLSAVYEMSADSAYIVADNSDDIYLKTTSMIKNVLKLK